MSNDFTLPFLHLPLEKLITWNDRITEIWEQVSGFQAIGTGAKSGSGYKEYNNAGLLFEGTVLHPCCGGANANLYTGSNCKELYAQMSACENWVKLTVLCQRQCLSYSCRSHHKGKLVEEFTGLCEQQLFVVP